MTTRALEDQEIKAIFENIDGCNATRNRAMLIAGIGMALRASELVGLTVGDVVDGNNNVKQYVTIRGEIAKFGKERTIRIGDDIQKAIAEFVEWKAEHGESVEAEATLFKSQMGGHLCRTSLFEIMKKIFGKAGIDQSCHALRKTGATIYYIESEYDLIATQQFLGHADPSTTRRYIGLTTEQIVEYAEKLSNHLFSAIEVGKVEKFDRRDNMSNFSLTNLPDNDLIIELAKRGFDIDHLIDQLKPEKHHHHDAKIITMRKVA